MVRSVSVQSVIRVSESALGAEFWENVNARLRHERNDYRRRSLLSRMPAVIDAALSAGLAAALLCYYGTGVARRTFLFAENWLVFEHESGVVGKNLVLPPKSKELRLESVQLSFRNNVKASVAAAVVCTRKSGKLHSVMRGHRVRQRLNAVSAVMQAASCQVLQQQRAWNEVHAIADFHSSIVATLHVANQLSHRRILYLHNHPNKFDPGVSVDEVFCYSARHFDHRKWGYPDVREARRPPTTRTPNSAKSVVILLDKFGSIRSAIDLSAALKHALSAPIVIRPHPFHRESLPEAEIKRVKLIEGVDLDLSDDLSAVISAARVAISSGTSSANFLQDVGVPVVKAAFLRESWATPIWDGLETPGEVLDAVSAYIVNQT